MNRTARWLVVVGWGLFAAALLLPAARIRIPEFLGFKVNIDETVTGWQAATSSMKAIRKLPDDPGLLLFCLAGLGNLALVLTPFGLLARYVRVARVAFVSLVITIGLGVMLWWPCGGFGMFRAGYYVWLVALGSVATGLHFILRGRVSSVGRRPSEETA